jgi:hypothetical protein
MPDYQALLPVDGHTFQTSRGLWRAKVQRWPSPPPESDELLCYELLFQQLKGPVKRDLKLWVYLSDLSVYHSGDAVLHKLSNWLEWHGTVNELTMAMDGSTATLQVKPGPP